MVALRTATLLNEIVFYDFSPYDKFHTIHGFENRFSIKTILN